MSGTRRAPRCAVGQRLYVQPPMRILLQQEGEAEAEGAAPPMRLLLQQEGEAEAEGAAEAGAENPGSWHD